MNKRKLRISIFLGSILVLSIIGAGFFVKIPLVGGATPLTEDAGQTVVELNAPTSGSDPLVLMYSAKFVCTEALPPGTQFYGTAAPIVSQKTEVLIHNPNDFPVTLYRKAVESTFVDESPEEPGLWQSYELEEDYSIKLDCDDVAKLLTGNPSATFVGTYGIGVTVEGFVVIGVGPQTVDSQTRYANLDVTAEYVRSSEVMKKDVNLQPWWRYWWWPLPWNLGYPYQRILSISDINHNIDCRGALVGALISDATDYLEGNEETQTINALNNGAMYDPMKLSELGESVPHALVPMIGRCDKINTGFMSVDYVLFSNKGPTDINPITGATPIPVLHPYPWYPGHWYDTPVVMSQNVSVDIDSYYRTWYRQRWIDLGVPANDVISAMVYFAPYWSNWGHWWWWWNGSDSVSIGVGDGESLDVEQIMPTRVIMTTWPAP